MRTGCAGPWLARKSAPPLYDALGTATQRSAVASHCRRVLGTKTGSGVHALASTGRHMCDYFALRHAGTQHPYWQLGDWSKLLHTALQEVAADLYM